MSVHVARLLEDDTEHFNLINTRTVELIFQRSPNRGEEERATPGLFFQVRDGEGNLIQGPRETDAEGVAIVPVRGGRGRVELLNVGSPVATYTVTIRDAALESIETRKGLARRLRLLGYQIGNDGPEGNGVADPPPAQSSAQSGGEATGDAEDGERGLVLIPGGEVGALSLAGEPITFELDRSILQFQLDESLDFNGLERDPPTLERLETRTQELASGS
jgi:hypothetical protein